MPKLLACILTAAAVLAPINVSAEPIKLKLAFFTSDRSTCLRLRREAVRRCRQCRRQGA